MIEKGDTSFDLKLLVYNFLKGLVSFDLQNIEGCVFDVSNRKYSLLNASKSNSLNIYNKSSFNIRSHDSCV